MRFGGQSIVVVRLTEDLAGQRDVYGQPSLVRAETTVNGCRVRPLPAREDLTDQGDRVTDPHRVTAPPVPAVVNLKSDDEVMYDGIRYQVVGLPRVSPDLHGRLHKVTIEIARTIS